MRNRPGMPPHYTLRVIPICRLRRVGEILNAADIIVNVVGPDEDLMITDKVEIKPRDV